VTSSSPVIRRFEEPDERRSAEEWVFEVVTLGGMTLGRASYEPGWKWSVDVGPQVGTATCQVDHVGLVVSGRCAVAMDTGEYVEMGPGDLFAIPPGHDSWVVGGEPYVSLHLMGADRYAAAEADDA
jgi:quercetin dioxygenase-like cupin family protein